MLYIRGTSNLRNTLEDEVKLKTSELFGTQYSHFEETTNYQKDSRTAISLRKGGDDRPKIKDLGFT